MSIGIAVDDSCISAFQELKSKRDINAVIYQLNDKLDRIVLGLQGNLTHDELLEAMPVSEPRFVVYDLSFAASDGARRNSVAMISWCPESVDTTQQAACAAGYGALKDALDGVEIFVEATGLSDLEYHRLVSRAA
ncbi:MULTISPECIES: cofilin family protein [unclassified Streptomyces]|uniref:cofilin family protein n=1 Tax=unclassified Streptomyces TaxID=2593676 RepID=UPI003250B329